jgi:hypothetical protein
MKTARLVFLQICASMLVLPGRSLGAEEPQAMAPFAKLPAVEGLEMDKVRMKVIEGRTLLVVHY